MKATITRPDGTRIEAEGTAAEIVALLAPGPAPFMPVAPQTCTCWAGLCPLHTMRTVPPVNPWPWFTLTNAAAACAGNPTSYWIATG